MAGRRLISGRQALGVEYDMRDEIYAKLLRLSFGFYDRHQTGQLMSRATVDLQSVRFFLGYGLIFFFQHVLTIVGVTIVLFVVDWKLALAAMAFTPVLIFLAYRYSQVSHPILRDVQQRMADVATVAEENIVGVHVVKSFAQEESEAAKFGEKTESVFRRSIDANRQRALYVPLLSFLPLIAQATVLLYGGRMVASGELALNSFFAFNVLVLMLVMPLRMLGMWIGQAQRATASGERIFEVIDETEDVTDARGARELPPGDGRIAFDGAAFGYAPERPVLEEIDLEIEPGRHDRAHRPNGLGEDDARITGPALLRRDRGPGHHRRRRRPRREAGVLAARDRRSSPRILSSSPRPSGRTSRSAPRTPPTRTWFEPPASHRLTSSSTSFPTGTTLRSASAESRCPGASASGSPSPGRSSSTRASSSSTTRPRPWTRRPRLASASGCARR